MKLEEEASLKVSSCSFSDESSKEDPPESESFSDFDEELSLAEVFREELSEDDSSTKELEEDSLEEELEENSIEEELEESNFSDDETDSELSDIELSDIELSAEELLEKESPEKSLSE
eukprot:gb/GECH01002529.1/.p1 GENE.gb/GECH01002529.1/~~gb/GECH01002529.1/.p1  ORF type:complete len:118 (+),score=50.69 gb/GECH01002529.1/:1-354(+)